VKLEAPHFHQTEKRVQDCQSLNWKGLIQVTFFILIEILECKMSLTEFSYGVQIGEEKAEVSQASDKAVRCGIKFHSYRFLFLHCGQDVVSESGSIQV
jgi:hypothetical protein